MLELKDISFSYLSLLPFKKRDVFKDINLSFEKGKIHIVYGPNGVGKTTLLKLIGGFLIPKSGCLYLDGSCVDFENFPYEFFSLFTNPQRSFIWQLSIYDNLALYGFDKKDEIIRISKKLNLQPELLNLSFAKVSSGTQAKALLTKTILEDRYVILLDEPFAFLDRKGILGLKEILLSKRKDKHILIATAKPDEFKDIADRYINLRYER